MYLEPFFLLIFNYAFFVPPYSKFTKVDLVVGILVRTPFHSGSSSIAPIYKYFNCPSSSLLVVAQEIIIVASVNLMFVERIFMV